MGICRIHVRLLAGTFDKHPHDPSQETTAQPLADRLLNGEQLDVTPLLDLVGDTVPMPLVSRRTGSRRVLEDKAVSVPVSYTHLTLPTIYYV